LDKHAIQWLGVSQLLI